MTSFKELNRDGKFRTKAGWLKPYAFACGYREAATHPTDKHCYIHMDAIIGGYEVYFVWSRHVGSIERKSFDKLTQARKHFAMVRKTIVVRQRLLQAGVQL